MFQKVFITMLVMLTACGQAKNNTSLGQLDTPPPDLVFCRPGDPCDTTGLCPTSPFDGPTPDALPSPSSLIPTDSGYFEKTYPVHLANGVYGLSGQGTWNYILALGVPIFKVPPTAASTNCRFFAPLPLAPGPLQNKWMNFLNTNPESQGLLGLFVFSDGRTSSGTPILHNPAILIREDAQRWTLIHELHHYLFASSRVQKPSFQTANELGAELAKLDIRLRNNPMGPFNSEQEALQRARPLKKLTEVTLELDRRGPLEEFAIESLILSAWARDAVVGANTPGDLIVATSYMSQNRQKVSKNYKRLRKLARNLKNFCERKQWTRCVRVSENSRKMAAETLSFMERKMQRAYSFTASKGFRLNPSDTVRPEAREHRSSHLHHHDDGVHRMKDQIIQGLSL